MLKNVERTHSFVDQTSYEIHLFYVFKTIIALKIYIYIFLSTDQRMIRPTDTPSFGDKNSSENRLPMPTDRPTKRTNLKRFFRVRELNIVRSKRICALRMFFSSVFVSACLCVGFFKPVSNSANALTLHVWCPLVDNVLTSFNNAMTFKG